MIYEFKEMFLFVNMTTLHPCGLIQTHLSTTFSYWRVIYVLMGCYN